jgi:hypothetical protein
VYPEPRSNVANASLTNEEAPADKLNYQDANSPVSLARSGPTYAGNGFCWVYAPSSALYTDARPMLSAFAISVAPMPSAFMARTLATSIEPGRPLLDAFGLLQFRLAR